MLLFLVLTSVAPGERPCRGVLRGVLLDDGLDLVGVFVGVLPLLLLSMLIVQCHFDVVPLPCVGHEFESRVNRCWRELYPGPVPYCRYHTVTCYLTVVID